MKLLFDQNLSPKLVNALSEVEAVFRSRTDEIEAFADDSTVGTLVLS